MPSKAMTPCSTRPRTRPPLDPRHQGVARRPTRGRDATPRPPERRPAHHDRRPGADPGDPSAGASPMSPISGCARTCTPETSPEAGRCPRRSNAAWSRSMRACSPRRWLPSAALRSRGSAELPVPAPASRLGRAPRAAPLTQSLPALAITKRSPLDDASPSRDACVLASSLLTRHMSRPGRAQSTGSSQFGGSSSVAFRGQSG